MDEIDGEKGPWVLLQGFIEQESPRPSDPRKVFTFLRGVLVKQQKVSKLKSKFLEEMYPGNDAISEPGTDHYTYAGEIPWSPVHGMYFRTNSGKAKPHRANLFWRNKVLTPGIEGTLEIVQNDDGTITISGDAATPGTFKRIPGVPVEIPAHSYHWGREGTANDVHNFDIPAPAISTYLGLKFMNRSTELFDKARKKATITRKFMSGKESVESNLLFIRKDLLDLYLAHTQQTLVWLNWGERDIHYNYMAQRNAQAERGKIWEKHLHIHKSFHEYDILKESE